MDDIFFWKKWNVGSKRQYQGLLMVLLLLLCGLLGFTIAGSDTGYQWLVTSTLESIEIPMNTSLPFLTRSGPGLELLNIKHAFVGTDIILEPWVSYLFLGMFIFGIIICLVVTTFLGRYWYIMSVGLFVVLIVTLGLERIELFGWTNKFAAILLFVCYIPLTYYFNSINLTVTIKNRFLSLIGVTIGLGLIIQNFSEAQTPLLYIANYVFLPALIITLIFIFLVAHEVVYFILRLATQNTADLDSKNTRHFLILSLIYLINVLLLYLKNRSYVTWDIVYINPFFILVISTLFGIWGLKDREVRYKNILKFYPYVAYLYIGLGVVALSTTIFHFVQGNDAAIEAIEDMIVFSQLGFGLMFFLYIIVNFISLLVKNLPVYKVAFKEDNFPYFTARLAGTIVAAALFFLSSKAALYQSISSYYNGIGDVHYQNSQNDKALAFYKEGAVYGYNNHKSNYMIGQLEKKNTRKTNGYKKSTQKKPTEFSYVNLGLDYERNNRYFDAIFTYQKGLREFPESGPIQNNLGLLYGRTDVNDSTLYLLADKTPGALRTEIKSTNLLGVFAKKKVDIEDRIEQLSLNTSERFDVSANFLAYLLARRNTSPVPDIMVPESRQLNLITYCYLNNLGLWSLRGQYREYVDIIDTFIANGSNHEYADRLKFLKGLNLYNLGETSKAFQTLIDIGAGQGSNTGIYQYVMGLWALELGQSRLAIDYFQYSIEEGYDLSTPLLTLSEVLNGNLDITTNNTMLDTTSLVFVQPLIEFANRRVEPEELQTDEAKAAWIIVNKNEEPVDNLSAVANEIDNALIRDWTKDHLNLYLVKQGNDLVARRLWRADKSNMSFLANVDSEMIMQLIKEAAEGLPEDLKILQGIEDGSYNNDIEIEKLGRKNPFCTAFVLETSRYFRDVKDNDEMAYELLLKAIDINKYSAVLIKAYIDQCFHMGLTNYAESALLRLLDLLDANDYAQYERWFDETKVDIDKNLDNWE